MASKSSRERKSHMSFTLNQTLEMIKLNKKGIPITKITPKLGLFISVYQCVNVEEQFLKEIKSVIPIKTLMIRKHNSFIPDTEKVLVVWIVIAYSERCQICDL